MDEQQEGAIQSVRTLRGLNGALSHFLRRWDALQQLVDNINNSIEARSRELDGALSDPPPPPPQAEKANREEEEKEEEGEEGAATAAPKNPRSELEHICESMGSRALRRYVTRHLSEVDRLREDVPAALRRAPDPARLVLDCAGRFYRQGSRAYDRPDSPMLAIRRACILVLEFYLLSGCLSSSSTSQIDLAEIAREAALAWRARLVSEGGVASAGPVDALGLVLFLASFGIPLEFGCGDLSDLLRLSNLEKKAHVFRRSPFLLDKVPDIIKDMVSKAMYVEAVDLVCAFGLEEKLPPLSLLSPFLNKTKQVATEERKGQCPVRSAKEANEKQLAVLKSVAKCLEVHKLDSSGLGFDLDQRIAELEKDIVKGEQELKDKNLKRKAEVAGHSNKPETRAKHPWHAAAESPHGIPRHLIKQTQAQGNSALSDSKSFYDGVQPRNIYDGGFTRFLDGNSMGSTAGNVLGAAGLGSWLGAAAGAAASTPGSRDGSLLTNSIGGPYRSHVDGVLNESLIGHSLYVLPPSSGSTMEKGLMGPSPNAAQDSSLRATSSLATGSRSSVSSLYKFADTVLEQELHYNHSSRGYVAPTATPGSHSSSYFN